MGKGRFHPKSGCSRGREQFAAFCSPCFSIATLAFAFITDDGRRKALPPPKKPKRSV
jgi:hypothetical protein